jgi:cell division protein FtsL
MNKNRRTKNKSLSGKAAALYLVLTILFFGELFFYTWCRVQSTRLRYDIADLKQEEQQMLALQDNLKIELAYLKSPKRIAAIARDQLGLVMPGTNQTIVLPKTP